MNEDTQTKHAELVKSLVKSGTEIVTSLSQRDTGMWSAASRAAVKAGSLIDVVKRRVVYRKPVSDDDVNTALNELIVVSTHVLDITDTDDTPLPPINMTPGQANLWHMATGIFGEAAELLDAVVKNVVDGETLDTTNVVEELGDLEFYLEGMRQELIIPREWCLDANVRKLSVRYASGQYSDGQALARADKESDEADTPAPKIYTGADFGRDPSSSSIVFRDGEETVGALTWDSGSMRFKGNCDASARNFFASVVAQHESTARPVPPAQDWNYMANFFRAFSRGEVPMPLERLEVFASDPEIQDGWDKVRELLGDALANEGGPDAD